MKCVVVADPFMAFEPLGYKDVIVRLNIAESKLRGLIGNKIELTDLSETFDLGQEAVFQNGQVTEWKVVPVF